MLQTSEEIIDRFIAGTISSAGPAKENMLRAAIGQLSAERMKDLTEKIEILGKSNEKYAKSMKWLTFGLLVISVAQALLALRGAP